MDQVKVGVIGVGRGSMMLQYCNTAKNAKLVAICDKWEEGLNGAKNSLNDPDVSYYTDFDEFLKHGDMDVVVLANYANEHAPFAIKALNAGYHVISEVLPCQNMQQAVELVETVERTGKLYCYAENYCYMPGPYEMKRRYRAGQIGNFEYAEGEYVHNCEPAWTQLTYGDPDHWRNNGYAHFYCTHSLGPIVHITGLRPTKVVGLEMPITGMNMRCGYRAGNGGIEMVTFENGGIAKSIHGGLYMNNISYVLYGSKGRYETARECTGQGDVKKLYAQWYDYEGDYSDFHGETVEPKVVEGEEIPAFGHSGSDYYCLWHAMEKIKGNPEADTIDVYEALDMFLPGMFAYRSVLAGGITMDIPNLRNKEDRDRYRNDTACTDPKVAGDMLLPCYSKGNPDIPEEVYRNHQTIWGESHTKR